MRVEGAVGPGEAGGSAMQGAKGLRGASGAAVQPEGAVQGAVRGAAEPAWGVQGLTHGAVQPARSVQGVVGPGEVVWGAGRGAEGLRGASGVQPKGAVQGAVTGVLRPRGAVTVQWSMHAGCGGEG